MNARRLGRAGALFVTFAGLERGITLARGGKAEAWNFLSAGALTSGVFGFASGQLRRGMLIGGILSLVGLPVYMVVVSGGLDKAADRLATALVGADPEPDAAELPGQPDGTAHREMQPPAPAQPVDAQSPENGVLEGPDDGGRA